MIKNLILVNFSKNKATGHKMGKISSGPKSHQPKRTRGVWMQTLSYNKIHVVISISKK